MIKKIPGRKYFKSLLLLLRKNKPVVLTLIFLFILADIFFIAGSSDWRIFGLLAAYILAARHYKLKSRVTFLWCLFLLLIMFLQFLFTGPAERTEKTAVWIVLFLLIGIMQQWKE